MNREVPPIDERPVTPLTYLGEMVSTSWRHGGELAVTVACVVLLGLTSLVVRSMVHLKALSGSDVLIVLLPLVAAALMFVAAMAGWRLYRRQRIALATTRSLLDLNAGDRSDLERHLHWRYRRREARIEERNAARVERLTDEIAALTRH